MLRSIDSTKNGINTIVDLNDALAHNMANVNTTGYKQVKLVFKDIQQTAVSNIKSDKEYFINEGTSTDSIGSLSVGPLTQRSVIDFRQGSIIETGNTFDLALNGNGFFKVRTPEGEEKYTRNGAFTFHTNGTVMDLEGNYLLNQQNMPVVIDLQESRTKDIIIDKQGNINVKRGEPGAESFETLDTINIVDFANREDMESLGGVYFKPRNESLNPQIATTCEIVQGSLESSNADAVKTMIKSIDAMRSYESMVNTIRTASDTLEKAVTQTGRPISS